jgi:protein-S-isoprenylcysteine O-methyltransferase Ste14
MGGVMDWVIPALWAGWLAIWLASARGTRATLRRESAASRAAHFVPLGIAVALIAAPEGWRGGGGGWLNAIWLPRGAGTFWLGAAILAAGIGFSVWARLHLGANWSGTVTLKQGHTLVRSGPYALVRHPIYTGLLTGFLGTAVALGTARGLVALALVTVAFRRKIGVEEAFMAEAFGAEYARYRAEVAGLVPWVW